MSKNTIQTENMNHSNSPTRPSQVLQQQSTTKFNSAVTLSIILVVIGLSLICSLAIFVRKRNVSFAWIIVKDFTCEVPIRPNLTPE